MKKAFSLFLSVIILILALSACKSQDGVSPPPLSPLKTTAITPSATPEFKPPVSPTPAPSISPTSSASPTPNKPALSPMPTAASPIFLPNEFKTSGLPSGDALKNFKMQTILKFFAGLGMTTCCLVDFGDFELTLYYEGSASIDIVGHPDQECFSATKYKDLEDIANWRIIETDIKGPGYATARCIEPGAGRTAVMDIYKPFGIKEIASDLRGMNVQSSVNLLQNGGGYASALYVDNSSAFLSSYSGPAEVNADGSRALIFLLDGNGLIQRIIFYSPTAG